VPTAEERESRLRAEVGRLRLRETRRVFDLAVHVGVLGGGHDTFVLRAQDLRVVDAALRVDAVARLLEDAPPQWDSAWLSRPGGPEPHDEDVRWLAAASAAYGMHGRRLTGFHVVTRYGWRDVLTGEQRTWRRLRLNRSC